jgi:hypothetical protein
MTTEITSFQKFAAADPKCKGMSQEILNVVEKAWNDLNTDITGRSLAALEMLKQVGPNSLDAPHVSATLMHTAGYFADNSISPSVSAAAIDTLLKFGAKGIDLVCSSCRDDLMSQEEKLILLSRLFEGFQRIEGVTLSKESLGKLGQLCTFVIDRHAKAWSELNHLSERKTKELVSRLKKFDKFINDLLEN